MKKVVYVPLILLSTTYQEIHKNSCYQKWNLWYDGCFWNLFSESMRTFWSEKHQQLQLQFLKAAKLRNLPLQDFDPSITALTADCVFVTEKLLTDRYFHSTNSTKHFSRFNFESRILKRSFTSDQFGVWRLNDQRSRIIAKHIVTSLCFLSIPCFVFESLFYTFTQVTNILINWNKILHVTK